MVRFLESLPQMFIKRYVHTHAEYLKSIADIIVHLFFSYYPDYSEDWEYACSRMLNERLIPAGSLPRRRDTDYETLHFRNLRNCWYHEAALHDPVDDIDSRLRFAAWKIVQCYYAVFSSIAALVRLDDIQPMSHDTTLNRYLTNFICNNNRERFFLPPTNFYLSQHGVFSQKFSEMVDWEYADSCHLPNIKRCLEYSKKEIKRERQGREAHVRIGIPHYLKTLRDWANYQDAYLFFRLYGETVKENLDYSLKRITFIHCVQTEFFMLKTFGWDALRLQFETFMEELEKNLGIDSPALSARYEVYSENSDICR